jgi:uncharacterized protein (DUF3084 family)
MEATAVRITIGEEIYAVCPAFCFASIEAKVKNTPYNRELWNEIETFSASFRETHRMGDIKKNKLLEAKEEVLSMKAEAEKQINSRTAKIQSTENRLKQREMQINQKQEELNKKSSELDEVRANLESQRAALEKRNQELEKLHQQSLVKLETISGFSAQEAKEQLVESLKDEAKASAQLYIDEIVEEAKMTANKEAKRIVIQTIQRVATETSIENAVTVFHIDSVGKVTHTVFGFIRITQFPNYASSIRCVFTRYYGCSASYGVIIR